MKKVFIVSLCHRLGLINLHAFTDKRNAINYAINYLYRHSTLEDQQERIQEDEFDRYIEYSLYTTESGQLTIRVEEISMD